MKKRILCALLCVAMLLPAIFMTGCDSSGIITKSNKRALTITLYTITNKETKPEAVKAVEKAINNITKEDFTTNLVLKFYTEDEYNDMISAKLAQAQANAAGEEVETEAVTTTVATTSSESGETTAPVAYTNNKYDEHGELIYPDEEEGQVDIFLVTSIDQFNSFIAKGYIQSIHEQMIGNSKSITKFVNPTLLSAGNYGGAYFGVPNNRLVGEYEYLLVNKELVDKYYYGTDSIYTLNRLKDYLNDVIANDKDYIPLLDTYGVSPLSVSITNRDSLLGAYTGYNAQNNTVSLPMTLLKNSKHVEELSYIKELTDKGYLQTGELTGDKKVAAAFIKGDITVPEAYGDDYYVNVYKYPTATNDNVYNSMYAVSAYTKDVSRCMEIIRYMQTNEEFRNVFQYGEEDVHFTKDKNNFVTILNHDYSMNPLYTGNQFLMYQNNEMNEGMLALSANNWELAKKQNLQMTASPYFGFSALTTNVIYDAEEPLTNAPYSAQEMNDQILKLSDEYKAKMNEYDAYVAANGYIAYADYLLKLGEEFDKNEYVKAAISPNYKESFFVKYTAWNAARFPKAGE